MILRSILGATLMLACTAAAGAHDYTAGTLAIGHPWARATPQGAKVGGGYLTLTNKGSESDRLIGADCSCAGHVEIHEMKTEDGVMKMRPLAAGIEVKPGETVALKPGGYHMMFMELKEPLKEGSMVKASLRFEKAGNVTVDFKVGPIGSGDHPHGADAEMGAPK